VSARYHRRIHVVAMTSEHNGFPRRLPGKRFRNI
jgi:hypothetical protein